MSRFLARVAEILSLAESTKIGDRRTFIRELQDVYSSEEYISAINQETMKDFKGFTSWNQIMLAIHHVALKEAEKPISKTIKVNVAMLAQIGCCDLMTRTVNMANASSRISLSCADLMAIIFQIFGNKMYEAYQETYIGILVNVLENKTYRLEISPEQWQQILKLSISNYGRSSNGVQRIALRTARIAVQYGCLQSHLLLDVKKTLPFLETLYEEIASGDKTTVKLVYELTYAVCQQIATEYRITLCEFSEKILPSVITLEGCPEKYSMILLLVQIHHPGGAETNEDAGYAHNWDKWKNIVRGIYASITRDIKTKKLSPCFLRLACEIYRLIMLDSSYPADDMTCSSHSQEMQPPKRRRLSLHVQKPSDMLVDKDFEVAWPSVQIITVLLRKYPKTLKSGDYVDFLKTVTEHVIASLNNETMMDSLCELCTVLVNVEKEHSYEVEQAKSLGICWEKIWDTILRALSMNQNAILGHVLLQSIIEQRRALNPNGFLRLYTTNAIRWSASSVKTLLKFFEYTQIPDDISCAGAASSSKPEGSTKILLLRWCLKIPPSNKFSQVSIVELANLLTALVVRSWYEREFREFRNFLDSSIEKKRQCHASLMNDLFDDRDGKIINDIERCHLALEFQENKTEEIDEAMESKEKKFRIIHAQEPLGFLITIMKDFFRDRSIAENLENVVTKLAIFAKLMSNLTEFNIRPESEISELSNQFGQYFQKISSLIVTEQTDKSCSLINVVEALEILYTTRLHRYVAKTLIESSSMSFLAYIYNRLPDDDEDEHNGDLENSQSFQNVHGKHILKGTEKCSIVTTEISENCRLVNACYKILTYFCCTPIDDKMSEAQKKVLKNLMKMDLYENKSTADLRRSLDLLKISGMSKRLLESSQESLEITNNFIRKLYDSRSKDETAVRGILHVLPYFFEASTGLERELEQLLEILTAINRRLDKKKFGPLVHGDFLQCVSRIIQKNPLLTWKKDKFVEPSPLINVLLAYIDNPFYLVRLELVRALYAVFASENLQVPCKVNFFDKIESRIPKLFTTEEILNETEKSDERQTRTITAVQIYASIIRANEFISGQALYSMIKLSVRCNVKITTLKKALLYVTKSEEKQRRLIESNLHYLLSHWFESDYPLQLFPWILADCDSQEDFSRRHIDTLLSIKLQRCEFKHLAILCKNLEVSFVRTIENSFPTIMTLLMSIIVADPTEMKNPEVTIDYARKMYERLRYNNGEFEDIKKFDALLQDKLSEVLIDLLERLRDEEDFNEVFSLRVFLPASNPPFFTVETINRCFVFLEKVLPLDSESLVEYLAGKCPDVLERVIQTLYRNIVDANSRERKLQAFHQYRYFSTIILRELQKPYFDPMSLYIVRDTSYSLLALTKDESLAEMATDYFYEFLEGSMPGRSKEINEILSFVVSVLVPLAQKPRFKGAMKILNFLIIQEKELLRDAIVKLDSFPNVESYEAIKQIHNSFKYDCTDDYSLENEIEHFLNATNVKTLSCSHEGLLHVKNQLSLRKSELRDMYDRLERLRGFAEDCASSTIHKLIYKLVQLTRSSDTNISLEAAKCLGQLGPADLTTMILHPENVNAKENVNQVRMLTFRVIGQLVDYLVDNNTNLRGASSSALYEIFGTSWAKDLEKETILAELARINKIESPKIHHYVYPFVDRKKCTKSGKIYIDRGNWQKCIDDRNDLWTPASYEAYDKWIIDVTSKLLDCFVNLYTPSLKAVCRESVEFCEIFLPRLVHLVQSIDTNLVNDVCLCINSFFTRVYESLRETDMHLTITESPVNRDFALSYQCVRCMINVVNFVRIQTSDDAPMPLNYLHIAKAAQYCSAYFTSVLYAELWAQNLLQESNLLQDKLPGSWISPIDCICESCPEPGKLLQSIVREAYLHIGDPDSIYGCGFSHSIDSSYRIQHYIHLRQWDKVILAQDVELSSGNTTIRGILHALRQCGLQALLERVINTISGDEENVDDFRYEAAWRLGDWNILESARSKHDDSSSSNPQISNVMDYHASHYRALKCLRESDFVGLKTYLDDARTSLVNSLSKISLECSQTVYPILSQLRMLREIEDFASMERDNRDQVLAEWRSENSLANHDFQWVEPILSQRLIMYRTTGNLTNHSLIETHLEMAEIAEKQGYFQIAARSLDSLARNDLPKLAREELTYQEAFLAWKRDDRDIARYLLRNLIKSTSLTPSLRAKALRVYGNWMAVTKSENPQAVIERYYEKSIKTSLSIDNKSSSDLKNLTDAQADLAQFADAQYQQIIEFMRSPQYESLLECTKLKNDESKSIASRGTEEQRAIVVYQKQVTNDAAELETMKREKDMYLVLAAKYYLETLKTGEKHDLLVFRLVSLWLDNTHNDDLDEILNEQLRSVPSYKFIVLLPQLAAHMSNHIDVFTEKINDLMERCAKEHPHHTLPVLLALKNIHKDKEFKPVEKGSQRRNERIRPEPRVLAAESLITSLLDSPIRPVILEMSDLSHALVALAYFRVSDAQARKNDSAHVIPRNQAIMKIRNYAHTFVPTLTIEVRPGGNYNAVIGIREYVANFDLPGGVNAPKKVVCVGTDGIRRKQLVKGQDDLRQDAVMQQVCTVMNNMLRTSKETKKRKLHIRTYKIVPLSQRSGILEWCENTLPISNVLCDIARNPGMHTKYYPHDWSVSKCRSKLQAVDRLPMDIKLETFLECCKNLHPAFHHFFMEKYPSAETWFERRLAYVRSVATTSMVGYMLGLGDRHFSNILIDQTTAEVIHIDFGVAFAQGKVLPIPETVPFRLTRDMEVAMGICGVEGVMRRSCEETVAVLRDRRKILITLLQVLLYDPLFSWAITPVESDGLENNCTRGNSGIPVEDHRGMKKTNKLAERALLRIEQKLQGTEDGISSSISGQVERLIQQARDPVNLCRLYSGWQAYL